jgi:hypothetical protein
MNVITFEQAQKLYPDEWILFGNPDMKDMKVLSGVVIYHSKDKKEVCYFGKEKTQDFHKIAVAFAGELKLSRKIGILKKI